MKRMAWNDTAWPLRGLTVLVLAGCLASGWVSQASAAEEAPYMVQPGDRLEVSVWKEPDLTREVLVRPDGGLSFPLVGDVAADGMSVEAVRKVIAERLSRYISDPVVTVAVQETRGNEIYVIGEVRQPGAFTAPRRLDVMQALSMAGGLTEYADHDDIIILRRDSDTDTQEAIEFPYDDVADGKKLDRNIVLRAGDVVVVP